MSSGKAVLIVCDDRRRLSRACMRPQEHYDSPEFRGKIFTRREFRAWHNRMHGHFDYNDRWAAFNFPRAALEPFYDGRFKRLIKEEKDLLALLHFDEFEFEYVIAVLRDEYFGWRLRHEFAHLMFAFSGAYREDALRCLRRHRSYQDLRKIIATTKNYHQMVFEDEIVAFAVSKTYEWLGLNEEENHFGLIALELDRICREHFGWSLEGRHEDDLMKYLKVVEF